MDVNYAAQGTEDRPQVTERTLGTLAPTSGDRQTGFLLNVVKGFRVSENPKKSKGSGLPI
jgi:hypothetical protein